MQCPKCQADNREGRRFCALCGAALALTCPSCGFSNEPGERFCGGCGLALATPEAKVAAPSPSPESYTPRHLAEQILSSRTALEGERKQVTVLFADLKSSLELLADRDPEEARAILDPVLERMMDAVHRYEGTVNQVMGDGIMALFGAPIAHEDHAVRACYAALSMQDAVKAHAQDLRRTIGVPVEVRVGLNSGEVVVRSIGSDLRMDYTAVGQTTHLAARMEQLATAGSILLTPDTLGLAEGYVHVKPLGPMAIRGLSEPLEVYELAGASLARTRLQASAARGLTRFVGRDTELETLRQALEGADRGRGQVVAVVGEPGVGKSRLVYELVHSHRTHGWLVLEAGSISYGRATPYLPVTDLLKSYFRVEVQDDERRIREKVAGKVLMLDEALRPHLPAYFTLLAVPTDDPNWHALDPVDRRHQTLEAVRRLLLRESQVQPLVLVFEDLHWIDSETQALLDTLVESLPSARLLLLVNYRPEYQHGWGSKTYYSQIRLDPLGTESAEELLRALLGDDPGLGSAKRLLIGRTEGNPFFLEESVRTLAETGVLQGERGAYRLIRAAEGLQVPATVQALLAARIDRLPAEEKRLLQCASVIGKDVPYALLEAITDVGVGRRGSVARASDSDRGPGVGVPRAPFAGPPTPGPQPLRAQLAHLQGAEFLYEASLFPELEYTFKHALTHEVAYGSLLRERQRALHAQVLDAIERVYAGRLADHVERLAHHAVRGERWDKAVEYLQEASGKAVARSAYAEAVQLLEQAIEIQDRLDPGDRARRCDLLMDLVEALGPAGKPQQAVEEVAPRAYALAEDLGDSSRLTRCCDAAIEAFGRYGGGAIGGSPVLRLWAERLDRYAAPGTVYRGYADLRLRSVHFTACRWAEATAAARRALDLARRLEDPGLLFAAAGAVMGPGFVAARHQAEARQLADEVMGWSREGVPPRTLANTLSTAAAAYLEGGDRGRAEELWREVDALVSTTRDPQFLLWPLNLQALRAALDGELETAVATGQDLITRAEELGYAGAGRFNADNLTFWPLLQLGRAEEALEALPQASRMVGAAGTTIRAGRVGLCLAHLARIEEARAQLRETLEAFQVSAEEDEMFGTVLADLLWTAVLVEDGDAAALLARRLHGVTAVAYNYFSLTNVARALGRAALLAGDPEEARRCYERSLEWATTIRHRPEVALTRLELAELLLRESQVRGMTPQVEVPEHPLPLGEDGGEGVPPARYEALDHLEFVIPEFRAMKMQPSLQRAEGLRDRLVASS